MPISFFSLSALAIFVINGEIINPSLIGQNTKMPTQSSLLIFAIWMIFYGLGEETGWRGYLLIEFSKKYSVRTSTLYVSIIWALWHAPLFIYDKDLSSLGLFGTFGWFISLIFESNLLGWITKRSHWNIIPTIIWHATFNLFTTSERLPPMIPGLMSMMVIFIVIGINKQYDSSFEKVKAK